MAWNIILFNKTFHVEHIYFFDERSSITHHNQTGIQWRWGGVLHTRMEGERYGGGGVSKITIIIGIEHYTPTSPLNSCNPKPPPTPSTLFTFIGWGQKFLPFRLVFPQPGKLVILLSWWGWVKLILTTFHVEHIKIWRGFHDN